jgi:hypothetical protein
MALSTHTSTLRNLILDFPAELRTMIYELALQFKHPVRIETEGSTRNSSHRPPPTSQITSLLRVNRRIYNEAPILYRNATFTITDWQCNDNRCPKPQSGLYNLHQFIRATPALHLQQLRRLQLNSDLIELLYTSDTEPGEDTCFIPTEYITGFRNTLRVLAKHFIGLRELGIFNTSNPEELVDTERMAKYWRYRYYAQGVYVLPKFKSLRRVDFWSQDGPWCYWVVRDC